MEETNIKFCPGCKRNCDLNSPECGRGAEYARTGQLPEKGSGHSGGHDRGGPHGSHGHHEHHERNERDERHEHPGHPGHPEHHDRHDRHENDGRHGAHDSCGLHKPHDREGFELEKSQEIYCQLPAEDKILHRMRCLMNGFRHSSDKEGQRRIMSIINEHGGMSQRELMAIIDIKPGSLSELLGKLEAKGFIARTQSDTDRRAVNIELTGIGKEKVLQAKQEQKDTTAGLFDCLNEEEKTTLLELLERLDTSWRERGKFGKRNGGCNKSPQ